MRLAYQLIPAAICAPSARRGPERALPAPRVPRAGRRPLRSSGSNGSLLCAHSRSGGNDRRGRSERSSRCRGTPGTATDRCLPRRSHQPRHHRQAPVRTHRSGCAGHRARSPPRRRRRLESAMPDGCEGAFSPYAARAGPCHRPPSLPQSSCSLRWRAEQIDAHRRHCRLPAISTGGHGVS